METQLAGKREENCYLPGFSYLLCDVPTCPDAVVVHFGNASALT